MCGKKKVYSIKIMLWNESWFEFFVGNKEQRPYKSFVAHNIFKNGFYKSVHIKIPTQREKGMREDNKSVLSVLSNVGTDLASIKGNGT